jgi:hypothetical protein
MTSSSETLYFCNSTANGFSMGKCDEETDDQKTDARCITTIRNEYGHVINHIETVGECLAQFTNVKSEKKSRKIERFESNNNLKCKARY